MQTGTKRLGLHLFNTHTMDYQQTIEYLFNSTPVFEHVGATAYKEGLTNSLALDEHFGHPHQKFKSIHIAGTNGKGSCSHSIASVLQSAGYKVGLYTSPHLIDFRERIKVNGVCISEQAVVDFVEHERAFFEPLHPSFFELTTALAFKYFAEQNIDFAVVEVGLGGRLDCTNIITPILSIITNISLDHTQFLGDTPEKIAREKAGIIKRSVPVVIGEATEQTRPVFQARAEEQGAPITFAESMPEVLTSIASANGGIVYQTQNHGELWSELSGSYQQKNMNTVLCALNKLRKMGMLKDEECIRNGVANVCERTGLMGRWQRIQSNPTVIWDTGHNVGGWKYLSKQLNDLRCRQLRIVFGMVDDKDIDTVMSLLPASAQYYFTRATTQRAIPEQQIKEISLRFKLQGETFPTVAEAYQQALEDADKDDFIFVGGSSYIVADFLSFLHQMKHVHHN